MINTSSRCIRGLALVAASLAAVLAAACGDSSTGTPVDTPANLTVVSGNNQSVVAGSTALALVVRASTASGGSASGVTVNFAVTSGAGTVAPPSAVTDASGQAQTQLTVGAAAGTVVVTASVASQSLAAAFTITATGGAATCTSPTSLTAGQVVAGLTGTSICVSGGATGGEFALVPFFGTQVSDEQASFQVSATGTTSPGASPVRIAAPMSLDLSPLSAASFGSAAMAALAAPYRRDESFERALRVRERADLTPRMPAARAAMRAASAPHAGVSLDVIPSSVTVGQILTLNSNANVDCSDPIYRGGRVVSISNSAIVVADTGNPSGGYSDTEYASFGTAFDTLINPLDVAAFGQPSDIDHNGRILIFFTKTVNDLTPASNNSSYVGGFFYARDLFPTMTTQDFDACPTSNQGEMFYVMVPDPSRGGAFTKTNVQTEVLATLAHEYQHLINASRRLYVDTLATDFEEVWLNEGLSHIAEELLFYREAGLAPRENIAGPTIQSSQTYVDAYNDYQLENFGRYYEYLNSPTQYSVYADNDSLATRGATWSFLRYAADHQGTSDGTFFYQLVNSITSGLANLQNVIGPDYLNEIRDYDTAVLTDDVPGVAAAYQQPSWNFRSMFQALLNTTVFPLVTTPLPSGAQTVTLVGGASTALRFDIPAGGTATLQWSNAPVDMQFTLVRTK